MNYQYKDPDGDTLEVVPSAASGAAKLLAVDAADGERVSITVLGHDLPAMVAAMYEASGRREPMILDRLDWFGTDRTRHTLNGVTVRRDGRRIAVFGQVITATTARMVARALAEMAEDADNEPDPGEVERLAAFFTEEAADTSPEGLARQMLRRFKVEERTP